MGFYPWERRMRLEDQVRTGAAKADRLRMIYVETPANPTNILIDIQACSRVGQDLQHGLKSRCCWPWTTPTWGRSVAASVEAGADLVLYSATKYIGGHSDVIAGACLGSND
jgi:methionine-gamma-lyase